MQAPVWLPFWQAAASLLSVATQAAVVVPFMAAICLFLGRRRLRPAMMNCGELFLTIGLVTGLFGLLDIMGHGFVSLRALPAAMSQLVPYPYDFTSLPWRSTVTSFLAWAGGLALLLVARRLAQPVFRTAHVEMDDDSGRKRNRLAIWAGLAAIAACLCLFATLVLRNWPFLGLPYQMTREAAISILLQNAWREACAALMPAGGFAVLALFLRLPGLTAAERRRDREAKAREVIPGTTEEVRPLSEKEATSLRMALAFALAGATFQLLDAGFVAFSAAAQVGFGGYSALLRFGPFLVTAGSLVCWAFLFAKPARTKFLLALLPVLLILLRAVAGF